VSDGRNPQGKRTGILFVLSGASGSGKTALVSDLKRLEPELHYCVTATTREPRPGERDGVDYMFLSKDAFEDRAARGEFLEYAQVPPGVGNYYGSPRRQVLDALAEGCDVFLQVDVQGARSVRDQVPEARTIFLKTPDMEALKERLWGEGTHLRPDIAARWANAEIEMRAEPEFHYSVVNATGQLDAAVARVREIIRIEREAAASRAAGTDGRG
jgi:guanylate kinase